MFEDSEVKIIGSREKIRTSLIEYAKEYLELEDVDFKKTGFLTYIINVLSVLGANNIYFSSSIYREFFLLDAQLPESVYNLAAWIGYTPLRATPAATNILFTIPLKFKDSDVTFIFPTDFKVKSGSVPYTINSDIVFNQDQTNLTLEQLYDEIKNNGVTSQVFNNKVITVRNANGFFYPIEINADDETASFLLPFTQFESREETFQIPESLEFYQFFSKEIEFVGMDYNIKVYVTPPLTSTEEEWTQADNNSLFTMSASDKKFVWTSSSNKGELFFGNGVIGAQPASGSNIRVVLFITNGEDGKVIAGSLTTPDKLYYSSIENGNPKTRRIKLITTNVDASTGGSNSPTLSEIKARAIANLRSKERLVSEQDYNDFELIVPDTPLQNTKPILKRSDLKINEIMIFSELLYNNTICPTRNVVLDIAGNITNYVPKGTSYTDNDGIDYETLFDMNIDPLSATADYQYVLDNIDTTPNLEKNFEYSKYSYIHIPTINFSINRDSTALDANSVEIFANVIEIPDNVDQFQCILVYGWDGLEHIMDTNYTTTTPISVNGFSFTITNYNDIPYEMVDFQLKITGRVNATKHISGIATREFISIYKTSLIIRKDLSNFMTSSITDTTAIHNVPVILSSYLKDTDVVSDEKLFELNAIQKLVTSVNLKSKRMLTDFINIKFPDTTGKLTNMKYNSTNKDNVLSRNLVTVPLFPSIGDSYIVNGNEFGPDYVDKIATWNGTAWIYYTPVYNDYLNILDEDKKIIYTGSKWMEPNFNIPVNIKLIIQKDVTITSSTSTLVENVKNKLIEVFSPIFASDIDLDRSKILATARGVDGVIYARLEEPEIDIKFTYNIKDFTLIQLLDYTPQLVAFTYDSITVLVE